MFFPHVQRSVPWKEVSLRSHRICAVCSNLCAIRKFNLNFFCKLTAMLFRNYMALIKRSLIRNLFTGKSFIPATKKRICRVLSSCEIPSMRESSLENKPVDHLSHCTLTYRGHKYKLKRLSRCTRCLRVFVSPLFTFNILLLLFPR